MKTLSNNAVKRTSAFVVALFFSLAGFSQAHVTMSLKNITATTNTIEYDLYIVNDGATNLKLSACSYGVNLNDDILNKGAIEYSLVQQSRSTTLQGLTNFSLATTKQGGIQQVRMTSTPSQYEHAANLPIKQALRVGRFRITNSTAWKSNSKANFSLQESSKVGLTTTQIVGYIDESKKLVALTPTLKTVNTLIEESPILNPTIISPNDKSNSSATASGLSKAISTITSSALYPNPAADVVHIDFEMGDADATIQAKLFDVQGKLVKEILAKSVEGNNHLTLNIADLPRGFYVVDLFANQRMQNRFKLEKAK